VIASHSSIYDIGLPVVTPEEKSNHCALGFKAFQALLCPCCRNPRFKDCVDPILTLIQIMARALLDAIVNNKEVKAEFESCVCVECERNTSETCTTFRDRLKHNFYAIIESTCCDRKPYEDLQIDGDPTPPRMIPRECTDPSLPTCQQCGVKKKLHGPLNCPVWKECGIPIDTMEWREMPRSGLDSNGEQRTQRELCEVTLKVCTVFERLVNLLEVARTHLNKTSWANRAIKNIEMSASPRDLTCHVDHGATMNLHSAFRLNCSENAHCTDLVMIMHYNPRWVNVTLRDGRVVRHFLRDTLAVHVVSDTISKGKKTDAWGIRKAFEGALILAQRELVEEPIENVTEVTDNCKNQNKCATHCWLLSTLSQDLRVRLAIQSLQNQFLKDDDSLSCDDDSTSTSSADDDDEVTTWLSDEDPVPMDDDTDTALQFLRLQPDVLPVRDKV
jgi:hypothetical protein